MIKLKIRLPRVLYRVSLGLLVHLHLRTHFDQSFPKDQLVRVETDRF